MAGTPEINPGNNLNNLYAEENLEQYDITEKEWRIVVTHYSDALFVLASTALTLEYNERQQGILQLFAAEQTLTDPDQKRGFATIRKIWSFPDDTLEKILQTFPRSASD